MLDLNILFSDTSLILKFPGFRLWLIFSSIIIYGLPIMLVTEAAPNIYIFYLLWAVCGLGNGTYVTGINVYCLYVWRGHDGGGPAMHSIHFAFSLGTAIGPILATPFLSRNEIGRDSTISALYQISGAIALASSVGFFFIAAQNSMKKEKTYSVQVISENQSSRDSLKSKKTMKLYIFVALMCIFYLLYCGAERIMEFYLTTFAVDSFLHTTKIEGAFVNAVFLGSFTGGRFLSIILAKFLNPLPTMLLSMALCTGNNDKINICLDNYMCLYSNREWNRIMPICRTFSASA